MADFCNQCAKDHNLPQGDLKNLCDKTMCIDVLCESCGPCVVNHLGNCIGLCQREGHKWHRVNQTIFGLGGNCQTAVIASMFNMNIDDVPYFAQPYPDGSQVTDTDFNDRLDTFLESQGWEVNWYEDSMYIQDFIKNECFGLIYMVQGLSPRGYQHVVIYQDGELVHDPHPDFTGVEPKYFGFICKLGAQIHK